MKKILTLVLLFLFITQKDRAQSYYPVATTGYTCDAIAEYTTALNTTSGTLDGVNVMYSAAHAALIGSSYGLPNNGTLSSSTRTFQLQNYAASNLLFVLHASQDSLTFVTPAACQTVSLLDFATDAYNPTTMSVTIRFTDNSTQTFSSITVYDWLYTSATPFASGFDRMNRSSGTAANEGGSGYPGFFTTDLPILCANQGKQIKRIIITNTGSNTEKLGILAVSAVFVPLTAIASPAYLCNTSGSATLTAGGVSNYTWLPTGSFAGSTSTVISVTPSVTTEYTVQAASSQSCTYNAMVTVNVFSTVPTLSISNTAPAGGVCPTKTVILTASGATTYTWTGGATTITNGVAFAPPVTTDYTVTGGNACGTTTAIASVSVFPLPTVVAVASSASLCSGLTLTLNTTGSNASTYTWTAGYTSGVGFSPVLTSTYTLTGTSALNCTASAVVIVTVVTTPTLAPTSSSIINCIGNSVTLTATGATNYTWTSSTQTVFTPTLLASPSATGITSYTVTKSNANCVDTKVISVTTNSLPAIFALASPTLVCASKPTTLAAAGGQTYIWTSPGMPPSVPSFTFSGASPIAFPPVSTTYTVAANDGTCVSTTTVYVQVDPNPTIIATANPPVICSGETSTINATGGTNYTITTSLSTATVNALPISQIYTVSGSYNITGDNSFGCTTSVSQVIIVNPNPVVTASVVANKTLVCSSGSVSLNAGGANAYSWSSGALTQSTIVNPVSLVSGPVIYTVTGTYTATTCHSDKTVAVNIFIPTITVTGNTSTCLGGNINLTGGGGTGNGNYRWYTIPGSPATSSISSLSTTLAAPAVYSITALTTSLTAVLCPSSKTIDVNVFSNPVITAVAQRTPICIKESVVLTAGGGDTYLWNTGGNTQTISVSPNNNTTYTVTGTDVNGCVNTTTLLVKVSSCTGIGEQNAANIGLSTYPNPNNGDFVIQSGSDLHLILINDLGQLIRVVELSGANDYKISVNDLAKGIYFLTGTKDNVQINQKVIVAK